MDGLRLERGAGLALWRQIESALAEEIARGDHEPGARLPTEASLAERFGVNRHTIRRAIGELTARGLLRVEQGRGTFIQENVIDYAVGRRTRFSENIARAHGAPGGRLTRALVLPADETVAAALDLRPGEPVIVIERVGEADSRPINVGTHYFPQRRLPDLIAAYRETSSVTRALARCGVTDYTRKITRVTARLPSAEDAKLLRQPANRPILQTESINIDAGGRPIEYGIGRFASDRVQLVFEP